MNTRAPQYLCSMLPLHTSRSGLRSCSDNTLLQIPRSKSTSGDKAFSNYAPKLWNDLPLAIRSAPSLGSFKKMLKTHLFNYE